MPPAQKMRNLGVAPFSRASHLRVVGVGARKAFLNEDYLDPREFGSFWLAWDSVILRRWVVNEAFMPLAGEVGVAVVEVEELTLQTSGKAPLPPAVGREGVV